MSNNITNTVKPFHAYEKLLPFFSEHASTLILKSHAVIKFDCTEEYRRIFFIKTGRFSIYRTQDELLLHSSVGPALLGVVEYFQPRNAHYIVMDTECHILTLPAKIASNIFSENNLWILICEIQTYFIQVLQTRDMQLVGFNSYTIIRNKLLELYSIPEEVRLTLSVLPYIQHRSNLSRSLIAKILSSLREGKYIAMKNGKLIGIKDLPRNY